MRCLFSKIFDVFSLCLYLFFSTFWARGENKLPLRDETELFFFFAAASVWRRKMALILGEGEGIKNEFVGKKDDSLLSNAKCFFQAL